MTKMKTLLALLMALCMLMTALPVMAEETVSGTWYLVVLGLTAGTFDLHEDGTLAVVTHGENGDEKLEGTWKQEDGKILMTVNGQTQTFAKDGENLSLSAGDITSLGMSTSSLAGTGADEAVLASLVKVSREPGKLTPAELTAYQTDGTLPEGKTKEDMDAFTADMVATLMTQMLSTQTPAK